MQKALQQLQRRIHDLTRYEGRVGWLDSAKYSDGTSVAQVATWQEFGTSKVPPRPFFRPTIERQKNAWGRDLATLMGRSVNGEMPAEQVFGVIAQKAAGDVRQAISRVRQPKLSDVTLLLRQWRDEKKIDRVTRATVWAAINALRNGEEPTTRRTQPLNDTGYMITTLTGVAVERGRIK